MSDRPPPPGEALAAPADPARELALLLERAARAGIPAEFVDLLRERGQDRDLRQAVARWLDDLQADAAAAVLRAELLLRAEVPEVPEPPPGFTDHLSAWRTSRTRVLEARAATTRHPRDGIALLELARSRTRDAVLDDAADPPRDRFHEAVARIEEGTGIPVLLPEEREALLGVEDPEQAAVLVKQVRERIQRFGAEARGWIERKVGGSGR